MAHRSLVAEMQPEPPRGLASFVHNAVLRAAVVAATWGTLSLPDALLVREGDLVRHRASASAAQQHIDMAAEKDGVGGTGAGPAGDGAAPVSAQPAKELPSPAPAPAVQNGETLEQAKKAWRAKQLRIMFLGMMHTLIPFTCRQDFLLTFPRFGGNVGAVTILMASMSSSAGLFEFIVNPILGKISDACGRRSGLMIG